MVVFPFLVLFQPLRSNKFISGILHFHPVKNINSRIILIFLNKSISIK